MSVFRLPLSEVYRVPQRHLIDDDRIADKLEYEIEGLVSLIATMRDEWQRLEKKRRHLRGLSRKRNDADIQELRGALHRAFKRLDYRELKLKVLRAEQSGFAGLPSKNQMKHDAALDAEFG